MTKSEMEDRAERMLEQFEPTMSAREQMIGWWGAYRCGDAVRSTIQPVLQKLEANDADLESRIAALESRGRELTAMVSAQQNVIQNLHGQLTSHRGHLSRLQSAVDRKKEQQ